MGNLSPSNIGLAKKIVHNFCDHDMEKLWSPDAKSWLTGKDHDAGKDWEQKGMTEDEMVGWYHRNNGQQFEITPGDTKE